ncbi:MAG: hypothetical protein GWN87_10295 [Desulfuromonadales bacterium]|nr:hypothetical protein [Desulfuromonadales bacterium]NIS40859.1 hypothetical protein [Desulfuromonadales bacterium]
MDSKDQKSTSEYFVGQRGEFLVLDAFCNPIETVRGEIVKVMPSQNSDSVYAMIATERGIRAARLS